MVPFTPVVSVKLVVPYTRPEAIAEPFRTEDFLTSGFTIPQTGAIPGLRFRRLTTLSLAGHRTELAFCFASDRTGPFHLYVRDASGAGNDEMLYQSKNWCLPNDWSPNNQYILFFEVDPKTKYDLWVLRLSEPKKAFPFLVTEANEANARFSPDGKWVAYASDESGQPEVYVQPFLAEKSGKWQVSTNGGFTPGWSKDGKELFYLSQDNQIMCSAVKPGSVFESTVPKPLFAIHPYYVRRIAGWNDVFEPAPDGRFAVHAALASSPPNITVILNWPILLNPKK